MLKDKNTIMGSCDGGAYVGFIFRRRISNMAFDLLDDRKKLFSVEESIRRLTSDTAHAVSFKIGSY